MTYLGNVLVQNIGENCVHVPNVVEVLPSDVDLFLIVLLQCQLE